MIRSMTGYGRGEYSDKRMTIIIEIKSLNHRFLEMVFRLPEELLIFEEEIRQIIQERIKRGRVNLSLFFEWFDKKDALIRVDKNLAKRYYEALQNLSKVLGIKENIKISQIISFPEVVKLKLPKENWDGLEAPVEMVLNKALDRLVESKIKEGEVLQADLARRLKGLSRLLFNIEARQPKAIGEYRKKFPKKIDKIAKGIVLNEQRLEEEILQFAKNTDITEEVVRIKGHLKNFQKKMQLKGPVGKELDFLAQELHREANTICSKVTDYKISDWAIKMKGEIEKIREQLQNVE